MSEDTAEVAKTLDEAEKSQPDFTYVAKDELESIRQEVKRLRQSMDRHGVVDDAARRAVLLWSGGVDSTYIIVDFLINGTIGGVKYGGLNVIQVDWQNAAGNNDNKAARHAIRKALTEKYRDKIDSVCFNSKYDESDATIDLRSCIGGKELNQPPIWLLIALYAAKENDDIAFGYIKGDCFWAIRSDFENAFESLKKVIGKDNVKITYPLSNHAKHHVIESFNNVASDIYKLCWYCEAGSYYTGPCGTCESCEVHKMGEMYYESTLKSQESDDGVKPMSS